MGKYLIAHDLGTSSNKASLFSVEGKLINSYTASYDVSFFNKNYAEQDPEEWWNAICEATHHIIQNIHPEDVLAISFSAQMQSCIVVDKMGNALRKAMIWADQRAQVQANQLEKAIGFDRMYELTGHRVSPSYSIEKLMWIRDNEPEIYQKTYKMLLAKDYIIYKLTGKFVTDFSDASGTNAFDLRKLCWSNEILEAAQIEEEKMPELHASTDVIGYLSMGAKKSLHLTEHTAVVCGGGDGPCSALGAGCVEANQMFMSLGTSAWIGGTTNEVFLDKEKVLFCFAHVIPGCYMPCGTMQGAGSSYTYIKDTLCQEEISCAQKAGISVYDLLDQLVLKSPLGARGLVFLPYLLGERSPRWNTDTSGSFLGIKIYHEKCDYIRAVLEGIAMNMELILKAYRENLEISHMVLTGGGANGEVFAQIIADVLEVSLNRISNAETSTSIAAAVIAGVGVGVFQDFSEINRFISKENTILPSECSHRAYQNHKKLFDAAYHCLEPLYQLEEELRYRKNV